MKFLKILGRLTMAAGGAVLFLAGCMVDNNAVPVWAVVAGGVLGVSMMAAADLWLQYLKSVEYIRKVRSIRSRKVSEKMKKSA